MLSQYDPRRPTLQQHNIQKPSAFHLIKSSLGIFQQIARQTNYLFPYSRSDWFTWKLKVHTDRNMRCSSHRWVTDGGYLGRCRRRRRKKTHIRKMHSAARGYCWCRRWHLKEASEWSERAAATYCLWIPRIKTIKKVNTAPSAPHIICG